MDHWNSPLPKKSTIDYAVSEKRWAQSEQGKVAAHTFLLPITRRTGHRSVHRSNWAIGATEDVEPRAFQRLSPTKHKKTINAEHMAIMTKHCAILKRGNRIDASLWNGTSLYLQERRVHPSVCHVFVSHTGVIGTERWIWVHTQARDVLTGLAQMGGKSQGQYSRKKATSKTCIYMYH